MTSKRQSWDLLSAGWMRLVALAALGLCSIGCSTVAPQGGAEPEIPRAVDAAGAADSVLVEESASLDETAPVERAEARFSMCRKWNPAWWIGNADDSEPPDWYRPGRRFRRTWWGLRNPFHNFTFYVIGIADKDFDRTGTHPEHVFNPDGGWTRAVSRYRCWRLPFVSYIRGDFKFYLGWRERGNFGVKLTF